MNIKNVFTGLALCLLASLSLDAFAPSNHFRPFDYALRMPESHCKHKRRDFKLGLIQFEYGDRSKGRALDDIRRSVLQLYDCQQDALAMLLDQTPCVKNRVGSIGQHLINNCEKVDCQGKLNFEGDFKEIDVAFYAGYRFPFKCIPGNFRLNFYLPVVCKELKNVKICDQTQTSDTWPCGKLIKENVTDNLCQNVQNWGGLELGDWDKCGLGDLTLMLEWWKRYEQTKNHLKAVTLNAKLGVLFPTAEEKDEDKAFSMPLGTDGAWGMPVGFSLTMDFTYCFRAGIDVDFLVLFDKSRCRRMKTDRCQTEFLLLNKGRATKEYGLNWQFHLYTQFYHFFRGLSLKAAYQYIKHDDDRLCPRNNDFSFPVVNSAKSLEEWSVHNLIFMANYDFFKEMRDCSFVPQLSFFYKFPVSGKGVIDTHTLGAQVMFNF